MKNSNPVVSQGANPWDDEVYTESGVEYRALYAVSPEPEESVTDEDVILGPGAWPACVGASTIGCVLLVAIAMLFVRVVSADSTGDHWICQSSAIYSFTTGARQAEWDGATWRVLDTHDPANPADDTWQYWTGDAVETGIMYADEHQNENSPAYVEFLDYESDLIWRFAFIDTVSTFENGRWGMHHSCEQGPVVFDMRDSK
jgi:hypothetical protein